MPAVKKTSSAESRPSLRKASTLTLDDSPSAEDPLRKVSSKTSFKSKKSTSLVKKASLVAEDGGMCTALVSLESGSHVGKTASLKSAKAATKGMDVTEVGEEEAGIEDVTPVEAAVSSLTKSVSNASLSKAPSLTKRVSSKRSDAYVAPPLPPGGLIEIAISFDTTGSMYGCLNEVRSRIQDMVQKLQADIPGIRIAIIAHGDYCDKANYIIKWIDFGANVAEICDFVKNVGQTGGGDGDECYELVLRRAQEVLSWTPGSQRSLVIIGDASPHEPGYRYGDFINDIDWREESRHLRDMNVRIYSVVANNNARTLQFYKSISKETGGQVLELKNFGIIFDMLMTICYHEGGADLRDAYESEVRGRHGGSLGAALESLFAKIKDPSADVASATTPSFSLFGTASSIPTPARKILKAKRRLGGASKTPTKGAAKTSLPTTKVAKPAKTKKATKTTKATKVGKAKKAKAATAKVNKNKKTPTKAKKLKSKTVSKKATTKPKSGTKKKPIKRVKRESLTEAKFKQGPLAKLQWSPWSACVSKDRPFRALHKQWKKLKSIPAYYNINVGSHPQAIWEFGVQCPGKKKVYPVLYSVMDRKRNPVRWIRYFLTKPGYTRAMVSDVIQNGGTIMLRKAWPQKKMANFSSQMKQYMHKNYDYCWRLDRPGKSGLRKLTRSGFLISK